MRKYILITTLILTDVKKNKTTEEEGTGYVYLDSKNNVYIVNYDIDGININVSYTRLK